MFDLDVIAVGSEPVRLGNDTVGRRVNRRAGRRGEVNALVDLVAVKRRMLTHAEHGADPGCCDRHLRGNGNRGLARRRVPAAIIERLPAGEQLTEFLVALAERRIRALGEIGNLAADLRGGRFLLSGDRARGNQHRRGDQPRGKSG